MKKKDTLRLLLIVFVLMFSVFPVSAQLFETDVTDLRAPDTKLEQVPDDPFNDPKNVERFLEQFQRAGGRIVGGEDVDIKDYPWQVSMQLQPQFGGSHFCGGTIVDEEWVITAAHCLVFEQNGNDFYLTPGHVRVRAGFTLMNNTSQGQYYNVEELILHPSYSTSSHRFDIALVRLAELIDLEDSNMAKVDIVGEDDVNAGMTEPGQMVKVSGWGAISFGGPAANHLQAIEVPIRAVSQTSYPPSWITEDMILAGAAGKDACQGDSGGPMVAQDGQGWYKLAGVVSWGVDCGLAQYPGVYARVSYFEDWIRSYMDTPDPNQFQEVIYETFGDGDIPDGWSNIIIQGPTGFPGWEWTDTGAQFGGQLHSTTAADGYLVLNSIAHGQPNVDEEVDLISPSMDLSDVTNDIVFSVEHRARTFGNADIRIYISTDNFNTQTELYRWHNAPPNQHNGDNPVVSVFDITDIAQGESDVRIKFKWLGKRDYWWLLDDFKVAVEFPPVEVQFNVTDGENPLANVEIFTPYTGQETTTDNNGVAFLTLFEGEYLITAKKPGYHEYQELITITEDGQIVEIEMEWITYPEIVIDKDEIQISVPQGTTQSTMLNIGNAGDGFLHYALYAYPSAGKATENRVTDNKGLDEVVEIHYDNGYDAGVGTGNPTSFMSAARFTAEELAEYYLIYQLAAVKYHINSDQFANVTVKVWEEGTASSPGSVIYSEDVTAETIAGDWSVHILNEPIDLEPGQEYWIGYSIQTTGGHPASVDSGPLVDGKGGWMFFNNMWQQLTDISPNRDYNWTIRGILNLTSEVDWLTFDPQSGQVGEGENHDVSFIFNTVELDLGQYHAEVLLQHNAGEDMFIPVTLNVLAAEFDVTFLVKDENGVAVNDATITLAGDTNSPGDYVFHEIPVGLHEYQVEKTGYYTASGVLNVGFEDLVFEVTLISEASDAVTLNVSIDDEFGDAVEGAYMYIEGFGGYATNENGQITFITLPGTYDFSVTKTGFEPKNDQVTVSTDDEQFLDITLTYLRFDVVVEINLEEAGSVTGGGEYYYGQTAIVSAEANTGFEFLGWMEGALEVSEEEEYSFVVTSDRNLLGMFAVKTYTIMATAEGNGGINPLGEVVVNHGDDMEFIIVPLPGNHIEDVLVNGESMGTIESYIFENVTEDGHTIHAVFAINIYDVSITAQGNGTVDPMGVIDVPHGESVIITSTPDPDHHVADILVNGESVGGHNEYILTNVTGDTDVHVVFEFSVGIDELDQLTGINVYPNPATGQVTISGNTSLSEIRLYNMTGQLIRSVKTNDVEYTLNIGDLRSGMYLIRVVSEQGVQTATLQIQ